MSDDQPTAPRGGHQQPPDGPPPEPTPDAFPQPPHGTVSQPDDGTVPRPTDSGYRIARPASLGRPPDDFRGGTSQPAGGDGVFGIDPATAPGDVPWGTRQVVFATMVAVGPIAALTVLALLLPQQNDQTASVTTFAAAFMVAVTVLVDGWVAFWAWFYSLRRWHLPAASLGLRRPAKRILWLVPAALVAVYIVNIAYEALYRALSGHATPPQEIVDSFPHSAAGVVLFAILAVFVAPFFEEVVFRGFLFQGLASSFGLVPGVVVSAALFGAIHGQLTVVVPLFVLGVALAWVFHSAKSLWACIALHAVFNGISVLVWALSGG